jgi:hypothetical protein
MFAGGMPKVAMIVAGGFLIAFFVLASGVVNAAVEGTGVRTTSFPLPIRTVQTPAETVAMTFILFVGLAGAILIYRAGKAYAPRTQQGLLAGGFAILAAGVMLGYLFVNLKL